MKKLLTFFLVALLAFGVGWAAEVTDVLNRALTGVTSSNTYSDWSGKTSNSDAVYAGNSCGGNSSIQLRSNNNNSGIVTTASGGTVKKITVTWHANTAQNRALNIYGKNSAYSAASDLYTSSSQGTLITTLTKTTAQATAYTTEYTVSGDYEYIGFRSASGAQYIESISIVWETGGGSAVDPPTIDPAGGNFGGSQVVTLSHADADAIYYTLDGTDPTTSSTLYTAPFTITSTTTVKAIAVKDGVPSTAATATFTEMGVGTIAAAYALAQSEQFVFTGNAVVTYQNGRNVWIRDNSGSGMIYRVSSETGSFNNGDILDAGWTATNTTYNSIPEFNNASGVASSSNGGTVAPFDRTSTGVTTANVNEYVSLSNVTLSWDTSLGYCYVTIGNNRVYFRDYFSLGLTANSNHTYNIEGIVYIQNNEAFVYMTSATEVNTGTPLLEALPNPMTFNDSGTGNTITVTGSNLGGDNVGLTQNGSYFTPTLTASTGWATDGGTYWYFTPNNGSLNGTVAMSYTGRELSASETVTLANNVASTQVTVNYRSDVYILGNYGSGWDYSNGILMTYDATNNTYTASVTANVGDLIVFARKLGESNPWNTRILFGPNSTGDCWVSGDFTGTIDLNDDDPIYFSSAGTYTIEINASTGVLTITKEVVNTGDFVLVTDVNDLYAGEEIIFVNTGTAGSAYSMSTTQANNRPGTAVTVSNGLKVTATDATQIFTLEGSSSGWYFHTVNGDNQGYIYAASSGSNYLKTETTRDDNAKATISLASDGAATIMFQGNYTRNRLRYNPNNGSPIFSCYSSSSTVGNLAYIYKREASVQEPEITVNPSSLDLVIPAGGSSQTGYVTVTEENTTGTTTVGITGDGASNFTASLNNGTLTVTYHGTATQGNPDYATITLTNGTASATVTVTGYKEPLTVTITPGDGHTFQGSTVTGIIESNVSGATIEYSFDGTTWQTYDPNDGFTATVTSVGGTVTVYARATFNGETAYAQATYTRVPQSATCTADIVFEPTTNNGNLSTWDGLKSHISEGANYVSTATVSTLITSTAYNAIRFGSGNNLGELDLTLDLTKFEGGACKLSRVVINAARYSNDTDCELIVSTNVNTTGVTQAVTADQTDFADYVFNFDGSEVTSISIANTTVGKRVYVHSISLEYSCGASVEAPVITPASGTYYEGQTVEITAETGATIYYTTDGSVPTTSSSQYNGTFNVPYVAGGSTTVKAIAVVTEHGEQIISDVTSVTYVWGTPTVTIDPATHSTTAESVTVTLTGTPAGATIYYTTDGSTPSAQNGTEYDGPFSVDLDEIGDEVTVKAVAVYNGQAGAVATATYTRVDRVVEVKAPFFSPVENNTYYGAQTLLIECATPNAEIYYEIVEVSGSTAPNAANVPTPTKSSTYYDGTSIPMTVGNSYYVKAVAYIGNYVSTLAEGWYTILPSNDSSWENPTGATTILENVAQLHSTDAGSIVTFRNPVQVVFMSKFTNDDTPYTYDNPIPEYAYVRDNSGYGLIYFGKGAWEWATVSSSHTNSPATIFERGDWIEGNLISGKTGTWTSGLLPQVGTSEGTGKGSITSWPADTICRTPIIAEETTCAEISSGTEQNNLCGHYLHLRYTTMSDVDDYSSSDPRHNGVITDPSGSCTYYDRFWLYSGQGKAYSYNNKDYTIEGRGHYDQAWFNQYQNEGATFDVFCISDYYNGITIPYEVFPIDFLWIYQPEISLASGTYTTSQTVTITVDQPDWAVDDVVIYYKTDDMEEWAIYTEPILVNSDTHIQAYAQVNAKTATEDYADYVRSLTVEATYDFAAVEDPTINEPTQVVPVVTGNESLSIVVTDHNAEGSDAVTIYYVNGVLQPDTISANSSCTPFTITETTTVTAVSFVVVGNDTLWSNTVTHTYTFARSNGIEYHLLKTAPVVGNIYVIVNKAANMGMSNTQNDANRGSTGVLFKENTNKETVYGNDDIAQFVLEQISGNRYYFKNLTGNGGYLCVETNEFANLVTTPTHDASGYDVATVTVGANNSDADLSYPATITFTYEGRVRTMRYYANGRTFSTYADASLNEPVFLYGAQVTPLHVIERDFNTSETEQVTVSDRLIGVWAAKRILWAKDQNYASIDATSIREGEQLDYVRMAKLKSTEHAFQQDEWEQSNWVMIDFSNLDESIKPEDYVGYEFDNNSIIGYYVDDMNYRIKLLNQPPTKVNDEKMTDYPGFNNDPVDLADVHTLNHYVPSNFYEPNLNWGNNTGYWFEGTYNGKNIDTCLFFMNPKIQEVAQVWAVWNATMQEFSIYQRSEDYSVNGYNLDGAFKVTGDQWQYNRRSTTNGIGDEAYGSVEQYLIDDANYIFHVAIMRDNYNYGHRKSTTLSSKRNAEAKDSDAMSGSIRIYPLDLTIEGAEEPPVGVREIINNVGKTVDCVRYFNVMGMESNQPFDGINIVVTRYTDGTFSTSKVLK